MARKRKRANPFYLLLVLIGIAFTVTACAYFVLALRGSRFVAGVPQKPQGLMGFMDAYGGKLLGGEIALLALATWGAIGTDRWWSEPKAPPPPGGE